MSSPAPLARWLRRLGATARRGLRWRGAAESAWLRSLPDKLGECRSSLDQFGQASDHEFTRLAKGLSQVAGRLGEVRRQIVALDQLLRDEDEDRAISSAYALYKNSVDLVHANAGIAVSAHDQLGHVESALGHACGQRRGFQRDHLFLRIVTLSIRIEASRLPAEARAVFLNVAAAIGETGERIEHCTDTAFTRLESVIAESAAARTELQASEEALHREARQSIEAIQHELQTLQEALRPSADHSRAIAEMFATAQPQTLAVISALQHQDIVRQQLEHVGAGFHDLETHLSPESAAGSRSRARIEWSYVEQAARIQRAQLASSRQEIAQAGSAVVNGMSKMLESSTAIVERFGDMERSATAALDHCRIAELFDEEIRQLARLVERSQQANARTAGLVGRIEEVVRLFSEEIGRYELDVKIVALNAQIAAARLSSADALNKLAEETSQLADTNARLTRTLSETLNASLGQLQQVKLEGAKFVAIVTREKTELESGLDGVITKLGNLVRKVKEGPAMARRDFAPVHAECDSLLRGLRFPELIGATFGPALDLCRELEAAGLRLRSDREPNVSALARIRAHQGRYTMQKEEATHSAALAHASPAATAEATEIELFSDAPAAPAAPAESAETIRPPQGTKPTTIRPGDPEFGDNIELF